MKYCYPPHHRATFAFHRKPSKYSKPAFVFEDYAQFVALLVAGIILVNILLTIAKGGV